MSSITREVAKFLAGYAGAETLGHWWLGIWGGHLLPMDVGWFTFTTAINMFAMIFWPVALVVLMYFAWFRKGRPTLGQAEPLAGRHAAA